MDTAVGLIKAGDGLFPLLQQTALQKGQVDGAGLARAQGLESGAPLGLKRLGLGVGCPDVSGLERGAYSSSAGEVDAQVFRGAETELVDAGIGAAMHAGEAGHGSCVHTVTLHGLPGRYLCLKPPSSWKPHEIRASRRLPTSPSIDWRRGRPPESNF